MVNQTIRDMTRKAYMEELKAFQRWKTAREESYRDGWAFECRHGFHDNAEGLCGPCEGGLSGYSWDWREEIKIAREDSASRYRNFERRVEAVIDVIKLGSMSDDLRGELLEWAQAPIQ